MADNHMKNFQIASDIRAFAEQSVEQAKHAFDSFMSATHQALATFEGQAKATQSGARDIARKAASFAERNVSASFEFAQKVMAAKSPEEVARLHAEYVQTQIQTLSEQARELGHTAAEMSKPK